MERIVIVAYKPFPGKELKLVELIKAHWQTLDNENLVSDRKSIIMKSQDGVVIEVFGWKSKEAMEAAHSNEAILQMWGEYAEVCEYIPVGQVMESQNLFSEFTPIN